MVRLIQKCGYIKGGGHAGKYMKYIATREGVEKYGEHGLFGAEGSADLASALREVQEHEGNVWTLIYSLRREDAARLGYDNAESWRKLLLSYQTEMAAALKISPEHFRWYAAFHDEGHHPHIHMMVWSDDPGQGFLTRDGVNAIRSKLTNEIFKDEMYSLYVQKELSYKALKAEAQGTMRELVSQMENRMCFSPEIQQKMSELVAALENTGGKKQYGYLKKPVKELVDSIVDALAKLPEVARCYEAWNKVHDKLESYYKDRPRKHLPLSRQTGETARRRPRRNLWNGSGNAVILSPPICWAGCTGTAERCGRTWRKPNSGLPSPPMRGTCPNAAQGIARVNKTSYIQNVPRAGCFRYSVSFGLNRLSFRRASLDAFSISSKMRIS